MKYPSPLALFFLLLGFASFEISAQIFPRPVVNKRWDHRFGGQLDDSGTCSVATEDGGVLLGGNSESLSGAGSDNTSGSWGGYDYWVIKLDAEGEKEWNRGFGGVDNDELSSVLQTADGGYLLAGTSRSGISGDKTQASWGSADYWVIKINALGQKQWDKRFGGTSRDILSHVLDTGDGGFLLVGTSLSGIGGDKTMASQGSDDYWIVKIDGSGNFVWDKGFGGNFSDTLTSATTVTGGGYVLAGYSASYAGGDKTHPSRMGLYDYWIIRLDDDGNKIWDESYGSDVSDTCSTVIETPDGSFLLGGRTNSLVSSGDVSEDSGYKDLWLLMINSNGSKLWDKVYGSTDENGDVFLEDICTLSEGGFLLGCESDSFAGGDQSEDAMAGNLGPSLDIWLLCIDEGGVKKWDKLLGGSSREDVATVLEMPDRSLWISGRTLSLGSSGDVSESSKGSYDFWTLVLDPVPEHKPKNDYDGDGTSDLALFDASTQTFHVYRSSDEWLAYLQWGILSSDKAVTGDFDGDGRADPSVIQNNGTWHLAQSTAGYAGLQLGAPGVIAVPADYDGDGRTDMAIFEPWSAVWHVSNSTDGYEGSVLGQPGDIPVPADYDGDGETDLAVFRPSTQVWYLSCSRDGFKEFTWGMSSTDTPVPGDYDGDGKDDLAIFEANGTWHLARSTQGYAGLRLGNPGHIPVPADYDGDGVTDMAVFEPWSATWHMSMSTKGYRGVIYGLPGYLPIR